MKCTSMKRNMRLKDFDYHLPKNLIAQKPIRPRDHSRLLILRKLTGKTEHKHFYDLPDYLCAGDTLVVNDTKVMAARLIGRRAVTGGKVEVFLLRRTKPGHWQCLIGGPRRRENLRVEFASGLKAEILKNNQDGTWSVKFNKSGAAFMKLAKKVGRVPLPPYIKRDQKLKSDQDNYQTVYADDKKIGSVAAPTAGFHFTPALLKKLKDRGVRIEYITLRVGLGTFAPVKVDDITKHKMHAEYAEVGAKTLKNILKAKAGGRRIIAVGTTSVRTLESAFKNYLNSCHCEERQRRSNLTYSTVNQRLLRRSEHRASRNDRSYSFWTDIFIYPGHKFKIVDAMITNFHLPKSTLLMLVSAFAGRKKVLKAYGEAIKKKYRFYSYGDVMFII